jgi:peptidoglycan/xylan/chitin deacetylase (PgdA/CDA1 family)
VVILTFDAGSDAGYTKEILATLGRNGISAAFGITGKWAETNPDLVRDIAAQGHVFINHSYSHASFTGLSTSSQPMSREARIEELQKTETVIGRLTGISSKPYFRPPFGDFDPSVNRDVGQEGYAFNVMWSVDSFGWRSLTAAEIVARCLELAAPGAIYIFHVGSASQDGPALQQVIDGLRKDGYSFGSIRDFF